MWADGRRNGGPITPMPPALDTAAARSGPDACNGTLDGTNSILVDREDTWFMPASITGFVMPSILVTGVMIVCIEASVISRDLPGSLEIEKLGMSE